MNAITNLLNYIDEELLYCAIETISPNQKYSNGSTQQKIAKYNDSIPLRGTVKGKTLAISISAFAVCTIFMIVWAIIALTGNQTLDPYRLDKQEKLLDSFSEINRLYPDVEMAERLSGLNFNEMEVTLYYENNTDWQNSENWFSLIFNGNSGFIDSTGIVESVTLYCLFTGSLEEWKVNAVYEDNTQYAMIGETEVQIAFLEKTECSYAIFEKNGIIYDLRIQFGNSTNIEILAILESLLNNN